MSTKHLGHGFDCSRIKELLPDYLDHELQDQICQQLRAHLEECEDCRIFVKTVETTIVLYKHCPEREVPEEVRLDLRALIQARHRKQHGSGEDT